MLRSLLGLEKTQEIAGFDVRMTGGWILAAVLSALAIALVVYLYRSEERLTRGRRLFMSGCHALALLVLVLMILEPVADVELVEPQQRTVLVLLDSSRSMAIKDQRKSPEDVADAAQALGILLPGQKLEAARMDSVQKEVTNLTRFDLARSALTGAESKILKELNANYNVRFFSFDKTLKPEGDGDKTAEWIKARTPDGEGSQVGTSIEEAVARYKGQPLAGIVVISDFAWAEGRDPVEVARRLKAEGIPVFPVAVGLAQPPDVRLRRVIAPQVVFKGDRVPVRVQIESHGFAGKSVELELTIDGERIAKQEVDLVEGVQFVELMFVPRKQSGSIRLDFRATELSGETTVANNRSSHQVQVVDQKIKVLYIEGMPRWEYRYLRWVLLRDQRLDVKFLMTQGDPALARTSPRHISSFPILAKDAFQFDLIILGDVPASYFKSAQMKLIEQLIKERGGSLLMIAGPVGSPTSYDETPIAKILPVKPGNGNWQSLDAGPVVTAAGRESTITKLADTDERNSGVWANVRPMYLPPLAGAKPGATVLLTKPKRAGQLEEYPLVAWQRYGTGKSMFVATEDLWRMRLEVGDRYHARFWGQAIQFLALSRLLGKNKQISLETDRRTYSAGEQVRVFANVLTQSFEPVRQDSYTVLLTRKGEVRAPTEVELKPVPDTPGLYSGVHLAGGDGAYEIKARGADARVSNQVDFEIKTLPMEDRETAMQADVVRQVAEQSGGQSVALHDLGSLPAVFGENKPLTQRSRLQMDLWDMPLVFLVLVALTGIEWFMRRRHNLV